MDEPVTCGHCGREITQASRGWAADGTVLCHTGTIPPSDEPQDCYRQVTVYQHATDGLCCRADWCPDAEETHRLNQRPGVRVDVYTSGPLVPDIARATDTASGLIAVTVGPIAGLRARWLLDRKLAGQDKAAPGSE